MVDGCVGCAEQAASVCWPEVKGVFVGGATLLPLPAPFKTWQRVHKQ